MRVHARAHLFAVLAFKQVRYAHRELDDFEATLYRPKRVGKRFAVFFRDEVSELLAMRFDQFAIAHEDARTPQRRRIAPGGESGFRGAHGSRNVRFIAEGDLAHDLAGGGVRHVTGTRARSTLFTSIYPEREALDRFHLSRLVHTVSWWARLR